MRRFLAFVAKAAISALLLYLVLDFVNLATLRERLIQIDLRWVTAGFAALAIQAVVAALRWQKIAIACGSELSAKPALVYTLIGIFFNQTLPSTIGGDAARMWLLSRQPGGWKSAVYSVLIDRATGLMWLAFLVLMCLPWSLALIQNPVGRAALVLIGIGGLVGVLGLFLLDRFCKPWLNRWRLTRHLGEVATIAWKVLVSDRVAGSVAALSVAVHLLTVASAWYAAKSVGVPLQFVPALLLILPVILVAAIPISIAGWGVREGAMVVAFGYAGLSASDGLIVSLLFGAGTFIIGGVGGVMWIFGPDHIKLDQLFDRNTSLPT